jgi:hypothetical protein
MCRIILHIKKRGEKETQRDTTAPMPTYHIIPKASRGELKHADGR